MDADILNQPRVQILSTAKRLRNKAQGRRAAATLGKSETNLGNPIRGCVNPKYIVHPIPSDVSLIEREPHPETSFADDVSLDWRCRF